MSSPLLTFLKAFGATRDIKAAAIVTGIEALTGSRPHVRQAQDDYGVYTEITPTADQAKILRVQLEAWLNKEPGDVRVNLASIWRPLVFKKTWGYALGLSAAGFLAGKY